ncbi:MAG: hydantoinase B/oxoprolinase family protein [Actinomycetota bacterium]|nr:hydantoinase B/oxoprolinase family protein [Actinomycetota bacterium]
MADAANTTITATEVDPVTFEVIRHRLLAITDEQAATLAAISGSPLVTEANDFNVGLYRSDGSAVAMGRTVLFMASSIAQIVGYVVADCLEDPGIHPNDVFVVNHPWKGAMHAMDMGVVAPIFHAGEIVAWSGAMCHLMDIGGLRPSGFCVGATEMYQEGLQLPPVKLVDGGVLRSDVLNLILSHSRIPATVNLDIKGLIAANNTAVRSVADLIARYGMETVDAVMRGVVELSERRIRSRLESLPDAVVRAVAYIDNDGAQPVDETYEIALEMTKAGDSITFDFSASSPQAPSYVNCTWAGITAGVTAAVLPTIAYDIPWNAGLFAALTIECPEGLICNATLPAAVSGGTLEATWMVEMASQEALSKLVACTDEFSGEAQAPPAGGPDLTLFSGLNNQGERFAQVMLDILATGGGAYNDHDGVSVQGQHNIERTMVANVEANELNLPIVYLWRGLVPDSGGAGRQRGGDTMGCMWAFLTEAGVDLLYGGHGWDVPNSYGIFGGHPGEENRRVIVHESDVREQFASGHVPGLAEITGKEQPTRGRFGMSHLGRDSVLAIMPQAGGGFGDPLDRPTAAVQIDLEDGTVSPEGAVVVYGVTLDAGGQVDEAATAKRRGEIRETRRAWPKAGEERLADLDNADLRRTGPLGDVLEVVTDGSEHYVRCRCGDVLCRAEENWRERARMCLATADELGPGIPLLDEKIEVRRYACGGCGVLLSVDVRRKGAHHLHDVSLLLHG